MNTLPLQQWAIAFTWEHNGNLRDKKISKLEAARDNLNGAIIRIGRDQPSCNLYLEDSSVSGQHAEIYFNDQQQKFFIKSLQPKNTLQVDGQDLVYGKELLLKENSTIVLGLQKIEVSNIQIYELQSTNYSGVVNSSQNSNPVNSGRNFNQSKPWWQESTIQVAIIGAIVTLAGSLLTLNANIMSQQTEKEKQIIQVEYDKQKQYNESKINQRNLYLEKLDKHRERVRKFKEEKKAYKQLTLANKNCPNTVRVAISFTALDEVSETRGWFNLEKETPSGSTGAATTYEGIFVYAKTIINDKEVIWKPIKTSSITRTIFRKEFNYIREPFIDSNEEAQKGKEDVVFNLINFGNTEITNKVFRCTDEGTLLLGETD